MPFYDVTVKVTKVRILYRLLYVCHLPLTSAFILYRHEFLCKNVDRLDFTILQKSPRLLRISHSAQHAEHTVFIRLDAQLVERINA